MSLEDLERTLYEKEPPKREEPRELPEAEEPRDTPTAASESGTPAPSAWKESEPTSEPPIAKKARTIGGGLFWGVVAVTLVIIAFGAFYAYQFFRARDITLTAQARESALIGQPFEITAQFSNNLSDAIDNLRISLVLPEGAVSPENTGMRVITRAVGALAQNQTAQETFKVVNTNAIQSIQKFNVVAYYHLAGSPAKIGFDRKASVVVSFAGPAVSLDLSVPKQVFANETFPVVIRYKNASGGDFSGGKITLSYPGGFIFKGADPRPSSGNSTWDIPHIAKDGEGTITVQGSILSAGGSQLQLSAAFATLDGTVDEKSAVIATAYSPVMLRVTVNDSDSYVAKSGDFLRYNIRYSNNSAMALQFAAISAKLSGAMFDFSTLQTNGDFDSRTNTITWQTNNAPQLRTVDAQQGEDVRFSVRLLDRFPIRRLSDKNFVAVSDVQFSSPTVPPNVNASSTTAITRSETKVAGAIAISAKASSAPLAVNRTSEMTVTWTLSTFAADFKNVAVRAVLANGVEWGGTASSNISTSTPIYDPRIKEVIWAVGSLGANRGTVERAAQATFTIRATPDILQTGKQMPLMTKTDVSAVDSFSGISASASSNPIESSVKVF